MSTKCSLPEEATTQEQMIGPEEIKTLGHKRKIVGIRIIAILLLLMLFVCIAIIIYLSLDKENSVKQYDSIRAASDDQNKMFYDMMLDFEHHDGNISNETYLQIKSAMIPIFNSYDQNNDGYLSFGEYAKYLTVSGILDDEFDSMDWDKDGVISFRDMVTHLIILHESPINDFYVIDDLKIRVEDMYNYSYIENDTVWFEYAADSLFEHYDKGNNGYISMDGYINESASVQYAVIHDVNDINGISFNSFFESHFNAQLFSFILKDTIFGDRDTLNAAIEYYSNVDTSLRVELTLCPTTIKPTNGWITNHDRSHRRLQLDQADPILICCSEHITNQCGLTTTTSTLTCVVQLIFGNYMCLITWSFTAVVCAVGAIMDCGFVC